MNKELLFKTFRNVSGAALYVFLVSQIMNNGAKWFGEKDTMFTPFFVMLLFSLSAAVMGGLVFGQSVILFLNKKNSEGVQAAVYSVAWLGFYTIIGLLLLTLVR